MSKFDEHEFKSWLRTSLIEIYGMGEYRDASRYSSFTIMYRGDDLIDGLSNLELVCYLGEYLTKEK